MRTYVEVAINLPNIPDSYHYHLPDVLAEDVRVGSLVVVPFGRQRAQGVILRFIDSPEVSKTRAVEDQVDEQPVLTKAQIELARWMADETLAPLGVCIHLMLPPGLGQRTDTLIRLNRDREIDHSSCSPLEKRLINLLKKRGDLRGRQIDASIRQVEWRGALRNLVQRGVVHTRATLPQPTVRPKTARMVALSIKPQEVAGLDQRLSRVQRVHDRRLAVLQFLAGQSEPVEPARVYNKVGANNGDIKYLEENGLIRVFKSQVWRDPLEDWAYIPVTPPVLTTDQNAAWERIQADLEGVFFGRPPKPMLLFGVTGSGKTELYLRAVQAVLAQGKRVLILVPEISLTPQTVKRFLSRFPGVVGVIHSQLSEGERYDTWRRARKGELSVIVGPRSALFMPMEDLGLIVLDECHHDSYDQQDRQPYYRGASAAITLARLTGALVILGSATPKVTQFFQAERGHWNRVDLPLRILAHRESVAQHALRLGIEMKLPPGDGQTAELNLPEVEVVDMKQELRQGHRSIFSRPLLASLHEVLDSDQQAILYLNRLGTATYVFCRECGYVAKCPKDDKPLTYHQESHGLVCHTCSYRRKLLEICPDCGGKQIRQLGTGTEKVQELIQESFPEARVLRWDSETTRRKGAHLKILESFSNHQADFLVGTQMLTKGLDLPLVTLVGVILAEVGLYLPDYRSTERTFQVLTQVAGRAGRSPLGGRVILQTYDPGNYAVQSAAGHDYEGFFYQELAYRRELGYPPFRRLVRLEYRHHDSLHVEGAAQELANHLEKWIRDSGQKIELIGPAPCFFTRLHGRYRWQIILRGSAPAEILRDRRLPDWIVEVDPTSLL